ncbi:hypothetical protein [Confluentibacter citreus]|nr:hypothetical protein [Confluentibacter citreus]
MKKQYAAVIEHKGRYLIMKPEGGSEIVETKEEFERDYERQPRNAKQKES